MANDNALINSTKKPNFFKKLNKKLFKSFISNSTILKICELKGKDYKEYKNKLKKDKVYDNLLVDSIPRKVKKLLIKISPKIFYKISQK